MTTSAWNRSWAPRPGRRVALVVLSCWLVVLVACSPGSGPTETPAAVELESSAPTPTLEEGVRMIPVETPKGTFQVWAKRVGDNPTMKVLLLHGGPGVGHEYLEPLAEFLPEAGIEVPTLVIGARHDTMDPEHIRWMAEQLPNGSYLFCPDGSHLAFYDDQQVYMEGVIRFISEVDQQGRSRVQSAAQIAVDTERLPSWGAIGS